MLICPKCGKVSLCKITTSEIWTGDNGYEKHDLEEINVREPYLQQHEYVGKPRCPICNRDLKIITSINDLDFESAKNDFAKVVNDTLAKRFTHKEADIIIKSFDDLFSNLFKNCIIVPEGATYGDLIKLITDKEFDNGDSDYNSDLMISKGKDYIACSTDLWFKEYNKDNE